MVDTGFISLSQPIFTIILHGRVPSEYRNACRLNSGRFPRSVYSMENRAIRELQVSLRLRGACVEEVFEEGHTQFLSDIHLIF